MDPMYPSSRGREPVGEVKIKLCASLASQRIHFINQWQVLKYSRDYARDRKQRRLHLALIFDCTFHQFFARELSYFFSQLFCLIKKFLNNGFIVVQWGNEKSVSVYKWKERRWHRGVKRRDNSWHIESFWWVKIVIFVTWAKSYQRIDITASIKLTYTRLTGKTVSLAKKRQTTAKSAV